MFDWFPYRILLVRSVHVRTGGAPSARLKRRLALGLGVAALASASLSMTPAMASSSAGLTATITTVTYSLTVTPNTAAYGGCFGGNSTRTAMGFPNGVCGIGGIQITNTSTGTTAHIDVQGSAAVPADNGTSWTLCGFPACTTPGQDQFREDTESTTGPLSGAHLTTSPQCDTAFNPNNAADQCLAGATPPAVQSAFIQVFTEGPSRSTDASASFTTTITWIAVQ